MKNPFSHRFHTLLIIAALACAAGPAWGQASGARGEDFLHRVQANDTLIDLAARYTSTPGNWRSLQSLNAVDEPTRLPIGKELRIPFSMIPEVPSDATVTHLKGPARLGAAACHPRPALDP